MTSPASEAAQVRIYNDALVRLKARELDSFDDDSPEGEVARDVFHRVTLMSLSLYRWSFRTARVPLARRDTPEGAARQYEFVVPGGGRIHAIYRGEDDHAPFTGYDIIGGQVRSDEEALWALTDGASAVPAWSPLFRTHIVSAIAADRAFAVTQSRTLAEQLMAEAYGPPSDYPRGGLIAAAAEEDGQQTRGGVLVMGAGPLVEARNS